MRRIYTENDFGEAIVLEELNSSNGSIGTSPNNPDGFVDRLVNLIPSEIIAAFIAINTFVEGVPEQIKDYVHWGCLVILVLATPYYAYGKTNDGLLKPRLDQSILVTVSFVVWAMAYGGPFESLSWYSKSLSGILVVIWSIVSPILIGELNRK